jgi:hypothetical protein
LELATKFKVFERSSGAKNPDNQEAIPFQIPSIIIIIINSAEITKNK